MACRKRRFVSEEQQRETQRVRNETSVRASVLQISAKRRRGNAEEGGTSGVRKSRSYLSKDLHAPTGALFNVSTGE